MLKDHHPHSPSPNHHPQLTLLNSSSSTHHPQLNILNSPSSTHHLQLIIFNSPYSSLNSNICRQITIFKSSSSNSFFFLFTKTKTPSSTQISDLNSPFSIRHSPTLFSKTIKTKQKVNEVARWGRDGGGLGSKDHPLSSPKPTLAKRRLNRGGHIQRHSWPHDIKCQLRHRHFWCHLGCRHFWCHLGCRHFWCHFGCHHFWRSKKSLSLSFVLEETNGRLKLSGL